MTIRGPVASAVVVGGLAVAASAAAWSALAVAAAGALAAWGLVRFLRWRGALQPRPLPPAAALLEDHRAER